MKKFTLIVLAVLSIHRLAMAQIPNASFDNWVAGTGYEDPEGWGTPNSLLVGIATVVSKSTDAHTAPYAAKLESVNIIIITVPGVMGTGNIDAVNYTFVGGFPITGSPATLDGWYKYEPAAGDTALIAVVLTKWNTTTNTTDTVAYGGYFGMAANSYTFFTAPLFYLLPETPDSAAIFIVTSAGVFTGSAGDELWIDDLAFNGTVGIDESSKPVMPKMFPNPANNELNIELPKQSDIKHGTVYDLFGKKMQSFVVSADKTEISTASLPDGMYFIRFDDADGTTVTSGRFSVKH